MHLVKINTIYYLHIANFTFGFSFKNLQITCKLLSQDYQITDITRYEKTLDKSLDNSTLSFG